MFLCIYRRSSEAALLGLSTFPSYTLGTSAVTPYIDDVTDNNIRPIKKSYGTRFADEVENLPNSNHGIITLAKKNLRRKKNKDSDSRQGLISDIIEAEDWLDSSDHIGRPDNDEEDEEEEIKMDISDEHDIDAEEVDDDRDTSPGAARTATGDNDDDDNDDEEEEDDDEDNIDHFADSRSFHSGDLLSPVKVKVNDYDGPP